MSNSGFEKYTLFEMRDIIVSILRMKCNPPMAEGSFSISLHKLLLDAFSNVDDREDDGVHKAAIMCLTNRQPDAKEISETLNKLEVYLMGQKKELGTVKELFSAGLFPWVLTEEFEDEVNARLLLMSE